MRIGQSLHLLARAVRAATSFFCALSLLLCVGVCVAWVWSHRPGRATLSLSRAERRYEAHSAGGRLTVTRIDGLAGYWASPPGGGDFTPPPTPTGRMGVTVERGPYLPQPLNFPVLTIGSTLTTGGSTALPAGAYYSGWGGTSLIIGSQTGSTITGLGSGLIVLTPQPTAVRVTVPWRLAALATALPPAAWLAARGRGIWAARRRRKRVATGRCVDCGYDLRASAGRCPECGREPAVVR